MKLLRLGVTALVSAVLVVVPLTPASAHNSVLSSTPAEGSTVTVQPGTLTLVTNDDLLNVPASNLMLVTDGSGRHYGDGCAIVKGASISTKAQLGVAGDYTVQWRVVSGDGHPVSGSWSFHWAPTSDQKLAAGSSSQPVCAASNPLETPTATAQSNAAGSGSGQSSTLIWFLVALGAMVAAAGVTFGLLTRKRK
jgi:methionine-rich copper-binding protein CopC